MLGITKLLGRNPRLPSVTEEQWYKGGGIGFEIANEGEAGIRAFLETLRRTFPYGRTGQVKPNAVYGTLYKWAAFFARDKAFDPVRGVLADIIVQTFPVGPGDRVCGRIVEERRVHSIRTASVETGLHRKRLRKLLALERIISPDDAARADGYVLFDARQHAEFLARTSESVPLKGAAVYLGAGRVHARILQEAGFIKPVVAGRKKGLKDAGYRKRDLEAFLDRLLLGATAIRMPTDDWCHIPHAARRSRLGAAKIVDAIVRNKLPSRGRDEGATGYMSALVRLSEVNDLLGGRAKMGRP